MGRGRTGHTVSYPHPTTTTTVPVTILTSVKCVCFFSAPWGRNSSISAVPDWFSSNLAAGGRGVRLKQSRSLPCPSLCPGSTGWHRNGREQPGGPAKPLAPLLVPGPLPVTCQRGDSGGGERGRMLPIGHQLHHLGLEGHVRGVHGGEVAGLAAGSPQALQEGGNRGPALGRSTGGAGMGSRKSRIHLGCLSRVQHRCWWHHRDGHPGMTGMPGRASPWLDFSLLFVQHTTPHGAHPSSDSPTRVLRWDCPLALPAIPQPTPRGRSAPLPAARRQPSPGASVRDACPPPLPCPQVSAPRLSFPSWRWVPTGERGRLGGQLGTGWGAQGPPSHRCYVKPAALPRAKGSPASRRPEDGAAGVPRQGAQGHVRAGQTEQERARGRETAPWQGKAAGLPSAGCLGTPHKAASVRAPALPAPLGNGTGWLSGAGWQPG